MAAGVLTVDTTQQPAVAQRQANGMILPSNATLEIASGGLLDVASGGTATFNSGSTVTIGATLTTAGFTDSANIKTSVAAPAAAGSSQSDATAMTADNNFVTAGDGTKGVKLPTAVAGMRILVKNVSGSNLKVYPASGGTINALSQDAAITMATVTAALFCASSTTQWYTCPLLPS